MSSGGRQSLGIHTHAHEALHCAEQSWGMGREKGQATNWGSQCVPGSMPSNITQGLAVCFLYFYFKNLTWPHDTPDLFCFQLVGEHKYIRSIQNRELSELRCNQSTCLLESLPPSLCSGEEIWAGVHQGLQLP